MKDYFRETISKPSLFNSFPLTFNFIVPPFLSDCTTTTSFPLNNFIVGLTKDSKEVASPLQTALNAPLLLLQSLKHWWLLDKVYHFDQLPIQLQKPNLSHRP